MGWDNEKKIAILDEHIKSFDSSDPFESHISKPALRKVNDFLCLLLKFYLCSSSSNCNTTFAFFNLPFFTLPFFLHPFKFIRWVFQILSPHPLNCPPYILTTLFSPLPRSFFILNTTVNWNCSIVCIIKARLFLQVHLFQQLHSRPSLPLSKFVCLLFQMPYSLTITSLNYYIAFSELPEILNFTLFCFFTANEHG